MVTRLHTVPSPGNCRSSAQLASTGIPTRMLTSPIDNPIWRLMPWCRISHGPKSSWARTMKGIPTPHIVSPMNSWGSRRATDSGKNLLTPVPDRIPAAPTLR